MKGKSKSEKPDGDKPKFDQATLDAMARSAELARMAFERDDFPTFRSLAEAEAYGEKMGDAYFEICYHLEGALNVCLKRIHDLYAKEPGKRQPMQKGIGREEICPEGWPKHARTLVYTLVACRRFRHEDTAHAFTVRKAMAAWELEKEYEDTLRNWVFDRRTFEPCTPADSENARNDLLRLCDWIECCFHSGTHNAWYQAPDCFSQDAEKTHLANIGIAQRHLTRLRERDRKRWEEIHERAAVKHQGNLKQWGIVGKMQHDPEPRTWTHPDVDMHVIALWPLVQRYNWTYADLLKVLEHFIPAPADGNDRHYPMDSVESLRIHCRTICGLTKDTKGTSAQGFPRGWEIARRLFAGMGK